ncbi:hypothetical protein BDR04DRAFT_1016009 [Suillus decipiens]|nr:hypothetical protein BDR04DRAFT_1016009 [Suillus decipiens]
MLTHYTNPCSVGYKAWIAASLLTANGKGKSNWWACQLHEATRAYLKDRAKVPVNIFGRGASSQLDDDDIANEIHQHLQSIGTHVCADDIVEYLGREEVKTHLKLKKTTSPATAKCWMQHMDYRWVQNHRGQYIDGHEHEDVVNYRQNVFLKKWKEVERKMCSWGQDGEEISNTDQPLCVWFHDESTFYVNDRRKSRWVHKDASAAPYAKGEGCSLMVADFVSADHGWLQSPDGKESAQVLFKAGKSCDGYFSNDEVLAQVQKAMDIVQKHWPNEDHIFIFDNAMTHIKCPDNSLSARKMPKNTPKVGTNWGIEVTARNSSGQIIYGTDGKPTKIKICMGHGTFKDGTPQSLYFADGNARGGIFKGMATILEERGYGDMSKVRAECKPNFSCKPGIEHCCCRQMLYNEPDFTNVKSVLEMACEACRISVLFLPKFHCELNFIEQCWGHAKWIYRQKPLSTSEQDLQKNVIDVLASVSVEQMCKFMDAYHKGLTGKQAAWATKIYKGHRVLPNSILVELENAGL